MHIRILYIHCTLHSIFQGPQFDPAPTLQLEDGELLSDASFEAIAQDNPVDPDVLDSGEDLARVDENGGEVMQKEVRNGCKSPRRPVKLSNANKDPALYAMEMQSKDTQKSTKYAVTTYNDTMKTIHGAAHLDLQQVPISELPTRLAKFFMVVTKRNGQTSLNASTLGTIYQSLARFLSEDYTPMVDIKADPRFKVVKKNLKAAQKASCKEGQVPGKMRTEAFQDEHLAECWEKKTLGRDNPDALLSTVHGVCIMQLGFRAKKECYNLHNEDFIFGKVGNHGIPDKVEVSERITKTRQGELNGVRNLRPVIYADHANPDVCPVRTLLAFQNRKKEAQRAPKVRFFLGVKQSARKNPEKENFWFTSQPIGVNKVGELLPSAFKAAGIDTKAEHIAGTSGRKTSLEGGFQHSVPNNMLSGLAGHANANSLTSYVHGKEQSHKATSLIMTRKLGQKNTGNFNEVLAEVGQSGRGGGDTVTEAEQLQSVPQQTLPVVSQPTISFQSMQQQTPQISSLQQPPISMQIPFTPQMQPPLMYPAPMGLPMTSYQQQQQILMAQQLGFPVNPLAFLPPRQFFQSPLNLLSQLSNFSAQPGNSGVQQTTPDARIAEMESKLEDQRKYFLEELEKKDRAIAAQLQRLEDQAFAKAPEESLRREECR